jgi:anti-sigma B factor antagonist
MSRDSFINSLLCCCLVTAGLATSESKRNARAVTVMRVRGDLDVSNREAFREALHAALRSTARPLIVSLERCSFLDCSAVGVLVSARKEVGSRLGIVVPAGRARRIFTLLNLTEPLGLAATIAEASARLGSGLSGDYFA